MRIAGTVIIKEETTIAEKVGAPVEEAVTTTVVRSTVVEDAGLQTRSGNNHLHGYSGNNNIQVGL
ncbi:hypothetical protein A2U01_0097485, partial [Trifolium medium]|nr:hypothetical protein [Trifolium medium]